MHRKGAPRRDPCRRIYRQSPCKGAVPGSANEAAGVGPVSLSN